MSETSRQSGKEGFIGNSGRIQPPAPYCLGAATVGISLDTIVRGSWIPPGSFYMGCNISELRAFGQGISDSGIYHVSGESYDEHQHQVVLTDTFFVAETACTQSQWIAVMKHNPSYFVGECRPVDNVNWFDALEYCRILTETHREEGVLPEDWQWSLPTEAQWEYACRAGTSGPFAGDIRRMAWYSDTAFEATGKGEDDFDMDDLQTQPVKTKLPNAWGLYDMHGNVSEWCLDWYAPYHLGTVINPLGSPDGVTRVCRGGDCHNPALFSRSSNREADKPTCVSETTGFRPCIVPV